MSKLALFDPDAIEEINYAVGRHTEQRTRLGGVDRSHGYGHRYLAAHDHPEPRWWR